MTETSIVTDDRPATEGFSGAAMKLARAAALAAVLVPVASVASADPITCDPGASGGADTAFGIAFACMTETLSYHEEPGGNTNTYTWGGVGITNTLAFDTVEEPFDLAMSIFFITPEEMAPREPPGFDCELMLTSFGETCTYFRVEDLQDTPTQVAEDNPPLLGTHYGPDTSDDGAWTQDIIYFVSPTNPNVNPQLFHAARDGNGDLTFVFEDNITNFFDPCPGSPECEIFEGFAVASLKLDGDPEIEGGTDNFSDTGVMDQSVPEPATLLLLAGGIGMCLGRRLNVKRKN
jgi:hypothetical protein